MSQLFGQAQDIVTIVSFAAGLVVVRAVADRPAARRAGSRVPWRGALQRAAATRSTTRRTPERRELDYVRQTGASVETAKEVKIFGLNAFLIDRYRTLADGFYQRQPRARRAACAGGAAC